MPQSGFGKQCRGAGEASALFQTRLDERLRRSTLQEITRRTASPFLSRGPLFLTSTCSGSPATCDLSCSIFSLIPAAIISPLAVLDRSAEFPSQPVWSFRRRSEDRSNPAKSHLILAWHAALIEDRTAQLSFKRSRAAREHQLDLSLSYQLLTPLLRSCRKISFRQHCTESSWFWHQGLPLHFFPSIGI